MKKLLLILFNFKKYIIMEKLIELIKKGWDIKIYNDVKLIDGVRRVRVGFRASRNGIIKKGDKLGYKQTENAFEELIEALEEE